MNANELMIGNWVLFPFHNEIVKVHGVGRRADDESKINVQIFTKGGFLMTNVESIQEIPLSPEILDKCGFVKRPVDWYIPFNDIEVCWHIVQGVSVGFDSDINTIYQYFKHIKYLHQLQNLMQSLGHPLNIEL